MNVEGKCKDRVLTDRGAVELPPDRIPEFS